MNDDADHIEMQHQQRMAEALRTWFAAKTAVSKLLAPLDAPPPPPPQSEQSGPEQLRLHAAYMPKSKGV